MASAHGDGTCRTWNLASAAPPERSLLEGHINAAVAIAFAPDGMTLVSGSHDWTVRQWPAASGAKLRDKTVTTGHLSHVYSLNFAPEAKPWHRPAMIGPSVFGIWRRHKQRKIRRLVKADNFLLGVVFAPDGKSLAAHGAGATFRTYDAVTHRSQLTFKGHTGHISGLTYARDGSLILTSGHDKSVRLWDPKTGKPADSIVSFDPPVLSAALSPDNQYVLAAGGAPLLDTRAVMSYRTA